MKWVAVETALSTMGSGRPPHRSQRALLTHWAPALGPNAKALRGPGMFPVSLRCLTYTLQRTGRTLIPALCPARVLLVRVPLGQPPFLHHLRDWMRRGALVRRWSLGCIRRFHLRARVGITIDPLAAPSALVRRLRRYYGPVRLPLAVHHRLVARCLPDATHDTIVRGWSGDLPVLAQKDSIRARGLRPRGVDHRLAITAMLVLPSALANGVGTPDCLVSRLNTLPICAPVNASPTPSRAPAHDSGSSRVASPSM